MSVGTAPQLSQDMVLTAQTQDPHWCQKKILPVPVFGMMIALINLEAQFALSSPDVEAWHAPALVWNDAEGESEVQSVFLNKSL